MKYAVCIVVSALLLSCNESAGEHSPPVPIYLQNPNYTVQTAMYKTYAPGQSDVVMLGDSHSFLANWNELLGRKDIAVRGIMNDITAGYLQRLEFYVARTWPKAAEKNADIKEIESMLSEYCRTASVENININESIAENGFLKPSMTFDGIHLNAKGYAVWVPMVDSIIAKYHL